MAAMRLGYLILFVTALVLKIDGTENQFCQEQEETFRICSSRMEFFYFARSQSLDILCKEIAQYLSCVHETNLSCPDMPIFQDRAYTEAIQNAMLQLSRFCKGYSISTKCNERFVNHLVTKCTTILNQVQVDIPREEMCRYGTEYLECLQRATDICPNNTELLLLNVPLAMASTESAVRASCDDFQNDFPEGFVYEEDTPAHPLCRNEIIIAEVERCRSNIEHSPGEMNANECRHQRLFWSCLDHIVRNCRNAEAVYGALLSKVEDTYSSLCSAYQCPRVIENRGEDTVSYCMIHDLEPSDASYCQKLRLVPECIGNMTALCPPRFHSPRVGGALRMVHTLIEDNCGVDDETED